MPLHRQTVSIHTPLRGDDARSSETIQPRQVIAHVTEAHCTILVARQMKSFLLVNRRKTDGRSPVSSMSRQQLLARRSTLPLDRLPYTPTTSRRSTSDSTNCPVKTTRGMRSGGTCSTHASVAEWVRPESDPSDLPAPEQHPTARGGRSYASSRASISIRNRPRRFTSPMSVQLEVWGDFACFTRPEMKVERVSYDVMTPSAARGIVEAIYWKPEIRWRSRGSTCSTRSASRRSGATRSPARSRRRRRGLGDEVGPRPARALRRGGPPAAGGDDPARRGLCDRGPVRHPRRREQRRQASRPVQSPGPGRPVLPSAVPRLPRVPRRLRARSRRASRSPRSIPSSGASATSASCCTTSTSTTA